MNKSSRAVDVIVIGGGQAGLALGWHLQQHGLDFLILDEQTRPGGNWRKYYDSLLLRHLERVGSTETPAQRSRNPANGLQDKRASHRRQPS
ncbi:MULTISPECIES: FAD-dependent oxidoreductase [Pseudomonas]|uniref:NAD(P)-binding protein n=2 Tax=Pseudomonas TaxID=286 RepID=A0AAW5HTV1_PSEPU|nr:MULTISPECIES: FAD-dependent oxidoreductase [Pseudomonas]MCO1623793.1 NAD(P)-binding protein [Pseudomonas putida]